MKDQPRVVSVEQLAKKLKKKNVPRRWPAKARGVMSLLAVTELSPLDVPGRSRTGQSKMRGTVPHCSRVRLLSHSTLESQPNNDDGQSFFFNVGFWQLAYSYLVYIRVYGRHIWSIRQNAGELPFFSRLMMIFVRTILFLFPIFFSYVPHPMEM